ncbi:MAG TPA: ABC transporter permease [Vicinamibacterales bacterium]|nr:ABC transporter permease [Vicinamibacterales bacterium]
MSTFLHDIRHGGRLLLRSPGFTATAIAALAIGIGANTAVFSVVHSLLVRPLPYHDPDRLTVVWEHNLPRDRKSNVVSAGNFLHWRDMQQSFEDMAAATITFTVTLTGAGEPEEIPVQLVTAPFFTVLGVRASTGRAFTTEDDIPDSSVLVMSDRLWRRRFAADPSILQRTVIVDGVPHTVLGVMPPGFSFLDQTVDIWMPIGLTEASRTPRGRSLIVAARLRAQITVDRAQQDMERVSAVLTRLFPSFNTGWTSRVVPLREQLTGDVRPTLLILLGAVALVLLIACANVANLLLARAASRQRELAVRAALGAGRGRIVRQLLAESLLLAVLGGSAGLLLAWWAVHLLRAVVAIRLPIQRLDTVAIDGWVLAFTAGVSILAGLVFGLLPSLSASGRELIGALKQGGRSAAASRGKRTAGAFVIVEVALALILLVGAGLLVRSFAQLLRVDPGFDSERTVTMDVGLPGSRYDDARRIGFFRRFFERVDRLPGVHGAGAVSFLPLTGLGAATRYDVIGQPKPPLGEEPVTDVRVATNGYFRAMGIPLIRGRLFREDDAADAANRVVINEVMARRHWPDEDPIGKRISISWSNRREDEIIGVVGNVRHAGLDVESRAMTYWPYPRDPYGSMTIAIRAAGDPRPLASAVVSIVRALDSELAVADVRTMDEVVADSVAERRVTMLMLGIFAGAALLLAAVGIYGVIAYSVTERTQEIGIRMALGADRRDVLRMVVGRAMLLAAAGTALGAAGALPLTRLMESLLFDVTPGDPLTFLAVAGILCGVAAVASYVPGRRAARVDPVIALRAE